MVSCSVSQYRLYISSKKEAYQKHPSVIMKRQYVMERDSAQVRQQTVTTPMPSPSHAVLLSEE